MSLVAERAIVAWPMLLAEVLIFGTAVFALLVAPTSVVQPEQVNRVFAPLWGGLAVVTFVFLPLVVIVDTASMADSSLRQAFSFLLQVLRETHLGRIWSFSFPLAAALLIVAWMPGHRTRKTAMLCALAALLLLLTSLSSHAIDRGAIAVIVYFIHEIAAGLWIGAILGLWLCVACGSFDAHWLEQTCPRVSRLAGWTVGVLVLSGLYTAYYALAAEPGRLIYTAYGQTLVVKVFAAILVLLIGAYNRFFLIPTIIKSSSRTALVRNVGIESVLLIGILGLAALLANTPPAH